MKIRENCYMLGLGSTGGKIYKEFVQRHYKGAAANGSEQDHKALGDVPNKYILQTGILPDEESPVINPGTSSYPKG